MEIAETEVFGWKAAIKGLRNPMNSWGKSDSVVEDGKLIKFGDKDNELAIKLIKAGGEHRKFLRLLHIQCFITLPRYIWTELDTYKVATTRVSCSTMHKLGSRELTTEDFQDGVVGLEVLRKLNALGAEYRESKSVETLRFMKKILPEGFLQAATFDMSYETALNMYHQRRNHRMDEWSGDYSICTWLESLPMMADWLNLK